MLVIKIQYIKTKYEVGVKLSNLETQDKLESNRFIINFFGKGSSEEFVYDKTKQYGGIVLFRNIKDILIQYNTDISEKINSDLVKEVNESVEKVMSEIQDGYADLLFTQRAKYQTVADQSPQEDWFFKNIMIQHYCCGYKKDQLKEVMKAEDRNDIYVLVLNEIDNQGSMKAI